MEMLYLAKCGIWGEVPAEYQRKDPSRVTEFWNAMRTLAVQTKLEPFVQFGVKLGNGLDCPKQQYEVWSAEMRKKALGRVMAAGELESAQKDLAEQGIPTAVLKGLAAASAYRYPELRSGCDIDLYVEEKKEAAVYAWAKARGCTVRPRVKGTHHGEISHPVLGLIELHVSLCNADEALVEKAKDKQTVLVHPKKPFVTVKTAGNSLVTIDHTEHLMFLVSHMINHYLHGEACLRHMTDVNAFFAAYGQQMEQETLFSDLAKLRYQKFFGMVLLLGNRYLGFSHDEKLLERLLGMSLSQGSKAADELLADYLAVMTEKEDALKVYDTYCRQMIPTGFSAVIYKLRILEKNVRTAFQLRHKMSWTQMGKIGWQRMRNLFGGGGEIEKPSVETGEEKGAAERRISMMKQAGLFD